MSTDTGFSTESTYFNEREARITAEIEVAKKKVDEQREWFSTQAKLLIQQRDEVLDKTAILRRSREELKERIVFSNEALVSLQKTVAECEMLAGSLGELLAPEMQTLEMLNEKIRELEQQRDKKLAKPTHEIEGLEARLARLRLRRTIAMKRLQAEADKPDTAGV
jgi:chromosome segregation ATPase